MIHTSVFESVLPKGVIIKILRDQVDPMPSLFRCAISLNCARYIGTSRICAKIGSDAFELRNRKDPYLSLRACANFIDEGSGSVIRISWKTPAFVWFLVSIAPRSYANDKTVILKFMEEWLHIRPPQMEGPGTDWQP